VNRLRWLITLPLAIVLVVFAVNNRDMVEVDLWPLGLVVPWPLFVYVFLGTGIGLLMGALVAWISAGPARKLARERRARLRELEHTIETMQARLDAGEPKLRCRNSPTVHPFAASLLTPDRIVGTAPEDHAAANLLMTETTS
jgi:uncharacterized integral membrane protein